MFTNWVYINNLNKNYRMHISVRRKQYIKYFIDFLILGSLFGITFPIILTRSFTLEIYLRGLTFGFVISFLSLLGNYTFLRSFRKLPFIVYILIKSIYFTIVGASVILIFAHFNNNLPPEFDIRFTTYLSIQYSLIISLVFNLIIYVRRLLGPDVFYNFITGRYHKPTEVERVFMFLDLNNSTTIAERIGHINFHKYLNQFYFDISDLILGSGGIIYKYVGDEVIINWKPKTGIKRNNSIMVAFKIIERIEKKKEYYLEKFGVFPEFKIGLHIGKVIAGELGDFKREIAFLGDTVNTTKRIQDACKNLNVNILLSKALKDALPESNLVFLSLGDVVLKGKKKRMEVFTVAEP